MMLYEIIFSISCVLTVNLCFLFQLKGGVFDEKYVKSCRVRTGRGVKGMCFPPAMSRAERREVERLIVEGLKGLTGNLVGKYYPLGKMSKEEEKQLIDDHFLFQKPQGHLMVNSGAVRDWPDARGIWLVLCYFVRQLVKHSS